MKEKTENKKYQELINHMPGGMMIATVETDNFLPPGASCEPFIHNIYILECCTAGKGTMTINGKTFPIAAGDCYALFPGDSVSFTADICSPRRGYWCTVDGPQVGQILIEAGIRSDAPFAPRECFPVFSRQLKLLYNMRNQFDQGADYRRSACLYCLFGEILRYKKTSGRIDNTVYKAILVMETLFDRHLTVSQIASSVGLERAYFTTVFKRETGKSPYQYLSMLRLEKACELMEQKQYSASEAALATGLDPENFSRFFKRIMGISPREYLNRKKRLQNEGIAGSEEI